MTDEEAIERMARAIHERQFKAMPRMGSMEIALARAAFEAEHYGYLEDLKVPALNRRDAVMPNLEEAREQAWREWNDERPRDQPRSAFTTGWDARGQYDEQRITALVAALCKRPSACGIYPPLLLSIGRRRRVNE